MKCYNYAKLGHFACESIEPKKVYFNPNSFFSYVHIYVLVVHSLLGLIIHSRATKYVVKDQVRFVDYKTILISQ